MKPSSGGRTGIQVYEVQALRRAGGLRSPGAAPVATSHLYAFSDNVSRPTAGDHTGGGWGVAQCGPGGRRTTGQGSWFADHAVDMVFILLVLAAYLYSVRITNGRFFWLDEWPLMKQGRSLTGLFDQYNGALSTISLGVYRVLPQLFGFNYTPVRVVGFASLFAVPLAYYLTRTSNISGGPGAAVRATPG